MSPNAHVRLYEIGIASTIAHNLAKYTVGLSNAYTPRMFIKECEYVMRQHGITEERIIRIINQAKKQAEDDAAAMIVGAFTSHGASEVTVDALIGYSVERLHHMSNAI